MENEIKAQEKPEEAKMRQIIIETDGNDIRIVKSEVAGKIELVAILRMIVDSITVVNK